MSGVRKLLLSTLVDRVLKCEAALMGPISADRLCSNKLRTRSRSKGINFPGTSDSADITLWTSL